MASRYPGDVSFLLSCAFISVVVVVVGELGWWVLKMLGVV